MIAFYLLSGALYILCSWFVLQIRRRAREVSFIPNWAIVISLLLFGLNFIGIRTGWKMAATVPLVLVIVWTAISNLASAILILELIVAVVPFLRFRTRQRDIYSLLALWVLMTGLNTIGIFVLRSPPAAP